MCDTSIRITHSHTPKYLAVLHATLFLRLQDQERQEEMGKPSENTSLVKFQDELQKKLKSRLWHLQLSLMIWWQLGKSKHRSLESYGIMRIVVGAKLIIVVQDQLSIVIEIQFKSLGHIRKIGEKCSLTAHETTCMRLRYQQSMVI
jgi:hypothetical protein